MPVTDPLTTQQTKCQNQDSQYKPDNKDVKKSKSKLKRNKSRKSKYPVNQKDQNKNQEDQQFIIKQNNLTSSKVVQKIQNVSTKTSNNQNQKQVKLNYFLLKKNQQNDSLSWGSQSKFAISEFQRKKTILETQLKHKQQMIEKLKNQRQIHFEKYAKLKYDHEEVKHKNKQILQQQLRQRAQAIRKQKAEINPTLGYYKQASWTMFIQGDYLLKAKKKVQQLQKMISQLQQRKRNARQQQKQRYTYQIQFLKKQKEEAAQILKNRQVEVTVYKNRLRLSDKEQNCTFAKSHWPLLHSRYLPMQLLGSGGFGQVYKCYDLQKNTYVALKTNCFEPNKSPEHRQQFVKHVQRQIQTLKSLNHPNIARLIEQIEVDSNKISFVMEYCSGPELSKYLIKNVYLEQRQAKGVIKQISFALKYMFDQKNRIIHYDLKPANIIFHNGTVKIIDFGLCKKMETEDTKIDLTSQGVGTYWYLPPETFKQFAQISSKVDIWSLGVIFYELLYGKKPFGHGINQNKIYTEGIILKAQRVQFPADKKFKVSEQAKSFIRQCLKYDPEQRLDPKQVYQHPYLH